MTGGSIIQGRNAGAPGVNSTQSIYKRTGFLGQQKIGRGRLYHRPPLHGALNTIALTPGVYRSEHVRLWTDFKERRRDAHGAVARSPKVQGSVSLPWATLSSQMPTLLRVGHDTRAAKETTSTW